ncbi:MAG TPA: hypothetical protein VIR58_17660 [Acidimicrobiales bacterium]
MPGAVETVVNAAVRNYGEYRSVTTDGLGLFTVSVFAIDDSRSENDILAALPQRSFARITVGAVTRAGYGLLPTSTDDPDLPPAVAAIQQVHFDIVLPSLDDTRLVALDPLDDEDLEYAARDHLVIAVERLLALFGPREQK